jgi:hypothetical protein
MDDTFIPLLPLPANAAEPAASPRLKVLPGQPSPQPFQPMASALPARSCGPEKPAVTLERDGDHVTRVRIQCPCGQVLELECVY